MLKSWIEILPLFLVRIIATKLCEKLPDAGRVVVNPRKDVMFIVK